MRVEQPKLHFMAQEAIEGLEKDGIRVKPESVLLLNHLAEKVAHPSACDIDDWWDRPYPCGNIVLFKPSIAAELWIEDCARDWFKRDPKALIAALAYALAEGRQPGAFKSLHGRLTTWVFLRWWLAQCVASYEQLGESVDAVLGDIETVEIGEPSKDAAPRPNLGYVVGLLMNTYGGTREDWIYRESADRVYALISEISAVTGKSDGDRERFINFATFRKAVEHVRASNG